ncbi:hypothetical protein N9852_00625 [Alphaproteobacteria bacterium]|jgi:hypothetical protein|nr:hypothetical protein [Alphaproteobacteria bacterium]MDB9824641.1 hypothetical protein [Alphaproteobacteria bacterium]|tara:strand:- start:164 stop:454 length:291 start_codon:yes stop_codon:yes gene_type:complete
MNKLITFFKAKSFFHLIIIFIVFGISGSLSVVVSGPILDYIQIEKLVTYYPAYLLIRFILIFPIYQFVLIIIAIVFGEYKYFLEFEKKMIRRLKFF